MPIANRIAKIKLAYSTQPDTPGGEPVLNDVVTTGGRVEDLSEDERTAIGAEYSEQSFSITIPRTQASEEAFRGTSTRPAVDTGVIEDIPYNIQSVGRVSPNKIRLLLSLSQ